MPRFPQQQPGDEPTLPELDAGFRGVNQRIERGQLNTGYLWDAVNVRMDNQDARTRPGCMLPIHFNHISRSSILGAGIYNDPEGREWMVICEPRQVWLCADGWQPQLLVIPAGQELTGSVEIIQCGQELRLLRGALDTLTWDGDRTIPQFRELPAPSGPTFLQRQPNAAWAVLQADRLWVPISRDEMAWSDVLDFNAFDPLTASVRFNRVTDDSLVAAMPYDRDRMVVFKTRSIYTLSNVTGDLSELRLDDVSVTQGCIARRTVVAVGDDVLYLARGGVYRLSETEQATKLQGVPIPLSYAVPRWMERVNWNAASDACACVSGDYYLLAVPVDGATRNNAILVYHLPSKEWHSIDFYGEVPEAYGSVDAIESEIWAASSFGITTPVWTDLPDISLSRGQGFVTTTLFGKQTAFLVDGQRVIALGHGCMDRLESPRHIQTRIETRGYALGELLTKPVKRVVLQVATRDASLSLETLTDGVRESQTVLSNVTRDRTRYLRLGRGRFDTTNPSDSFNEPYREDYTWLAGDALQLGAEGVRLGDHQDYERAVPLARRGRWLACDITSSRGSLRVIGIQAEGLASTNSLRTKS